MRCAYHTALAALMLVSSVSAANNVFKDPLDTPAVTLQGSLNPTNQPYTAVASAGNRLVAVGLRGVVAYYEDAKSWQQAQVPVQSDLTGVHFLTPEHGWAVGHEGVILKSSDGGQSWEKQFDGRSAESQFGKHYEHRIAAGEEHLAPYLDQTLLNAQGGAVLPFLDVHFDNPKQGYAIGSFGMIAYTSDGGKTWLPGLEHIDNPEFLNLNAFHRIGEQVYIAGERGSVFRLDRQAGRFVNISTDYAGSFFGITGNSDFLLAFGLSGTAYRSANNGEHWEQVDTGVRDGITAAALTEAGILILSTDNGLLLRSADNGRTFSVSQTDSPMLIAAVNTVGADRLLLAGYQGLALQNVPSNTAPDMTSREY